VRDLLLRVDDRLVHGQVTAGWVATLGLERVLLVNDVVAADEFSRQVYASAVPPGVELVILSVPGAVQAIDALEKKKGICLVESLRDALALVSQGLGVTTVNVGGIHAAPGRSELLPFVWLSAEEADTCRQLAALGIALDARMLPAGPGHDLVKLLSERQAAGR
jgi:mannose/fructose/N-acetylgalactosamine-specific phosphotransferase system component IIB